MVMYIVIEVIIAYMAIIGFKTWLGKNKDK